jgi:hypothetical protein
MLADSGPSFLLIKVNEQLEEADRIALAPAEMAKRFKQSVS